MHVQGNFSDRDIPGSIGIHLFPCLFGHLFVTIVIILPYSCRDDHVPIRLAKTLQEPYIFQQPLCHSSRLAASSLRSWKQGLQSQPSLLVANLPRFPRKKTHTCEGIEQNIGHVCMIEHEEKGRGWR